MTTLRQKALAGMLHWYPLPSGCGTIANHRLVQALAGRSAELVWARCEEGYVRCSLADFIGRAAFYVGELDRKISWLAQRLVRRGGVALDVGANIGTVTLLLSRLVGRDGQVHSFEPNPYIAMMLEKTLERNGLANVVLHCVGLGSEPGRLTLNVPLHNAGAGSLVRAYGGQTCQLEVGVETLDEVVERSGLERLNFVKLDVEGFEGEVLRGGLGVLERLRPRAIVFEMNDPQVDVCENEVFRSLRDIGYGFFAIPKCLVRMRLQYFDPWVNKSCSSHDFVASPRGEAYEQVARAVRATG